ncbi:MAG: crossover junction endodeoxyribonuclease RuvC [Candidatus Omnitrophota bacterium]|nr:MAG: crossover junction endodeoxyribonuclease RuvC [Candidatus Omnitrophota bacterium]
MRILGVDPGLGITGYGVIEAEKGQFRLLEGGIVKTSSRDILTKRLSCLYKGIGDIVREYRPADLVLEKLYSHYKHQMTAIAMAHARGVIALNAGEEAGLRLVNYPATRVKKALTGNGAASKMQVQRTVQGVLRLKNLPQPPDVGDALALAIAHAYIMQKAGMR